MSWAEKESSEAVARSLEEWVAALPEEETGTDVGVLGDWLVIVSMVRVEADGQAVTQYYLTMKGGGMLPHVARGLLHQGLHELREVERE